MVNKNYGYVKDGNIVYAPTSFRVRIHHSESYEDPDTGEIRTHEWDEEYTELHPELHPESYEHAIPNPFYPVDDEPPTCDEYHKIVSKGWEFDEIRRVCFHIYDIVDREFTQDDYDRAMEIHITQTRNARGYTTREPSAYATSNVPRFRQDAIDWQNFLDAVMLYALDVLNKVSAGEPAPSLQEFKTNLPVCQWTEE